VHGVNAVRQKEKHTSEPLGPESSVCESEMAIEKLERRKSLVFDKIAFELIKAGCMTINPEVNKPFYSIWNKEEMPE
jgi:hypothetical protein